MKGNIRFNELQAVRIMAVALFFAVVAGNLDAWWHKTLGRINPWELPHLLLYASVSVVMVVGWYTWRTTRNRQWTRLVTVLALIPLAAPFDFVWHRLFGEEDVASPWIVWSLPHIMLLLALVSSAVLLLPFLKREPEPMLRRLLQVFVYTVVLSPLFFVLGPIIPGGPHALIGVWGALPVSFVLVSAYLYADHVFEGFDRALSVADGFLMTSLLQYGKDVAPNITYPAHGHAPVWVIIASFVVPAASIDLLRRLPMTFRGAIAGLLFSALFFGTSNLFFESQFQFTRVDVGALILLSVVGGASAGMIVHRISSKKQ